MLTVFYAEEEGKAETEFKQVERNLGIQDPVERYGMGKQTYSHTDKADLDVQTQMRGVRSGLRPYYYDQ